MTIRDAHLAARRRPDPRLSWPDSRLVRECLRDDEEAWSALIEKYKSLIYSIPVKQGLSADDASDIFQRVCLLLLAELGHLRRPEALPAWLIRVTSRECSRWRRQERRFVDEEAAGETVTRAEDQDPLPEQVLASVKEEQILRDALRSLPPRCRALIEMLFLETPSRPYREVARSLGLATGSIGFIRGRCLGRLRRQLESLGFR